MFLGIFLFFFFFNLQCGIGICHVFYDIIHSCTWETPLRIIVCYCKFSDFSYGYFICLLSDGRRSVRAMDPNSTI